MSINSVSSLGGFSIGGQSYLSDATKMKLQVLGIDPASVSSETQAQVLIANAQARQAVQKTTNEDNSKNTCSSECELISRAKNLASKMSVSVSNDKSLSEILNSLSSKINTLNNQSEGDSAKIKEFQQFQSELSSIQSEYSTVKQNQNSMYTAMNLSANMNKFMLGIN